MYSKVISEQEGTKWYQHCVDLRSIDFVLFIWNSSGFFSAIFVRTVVCQSFFNCTSLSLINVGVVLASVKSKGVCKQH